MSKKGEFVPYYVEDHGLTHQVVGPGIASSFGGGRDNGRVAAYSFAHSLNKAYDAGFKDAKDQYHLILVNRPSR